MKVELPEHKKSRKRIFRAPVFRVAVYSFLIAAVALLQCHTLFSFAGQKVDESEVVAFAVGFLGGDLNPHWFGYGSFPLYALSAVYFSVWLVGNALGQYGSIEEYARALISDEQFFYGLARYFFACIGVATALFYARTLRNLGVPLLLVGTYFMVAITHPSAVGYANFVKVDQFVGLSFAVAVWSLSVAPHARRTLYLIAAAAAFALTSKISAAPILLILAFAGYLNHSKERKWQPLAIAVAILMSVTFVTQPYSTPLTVVADALRSHTGQQVLSVVRPHYDNVGDRILAIWSLWFAHISKIHVAVLGLLPFLLVRELRLASALLVSALLLMTAPFFVASGIQPYWMIPVYPLLCALPFLGAYGVYILARTWSIAAGRLALALFALLASLAVVANCGPLLSNWLKPHRESNQEMMGVWLERNVLGVDIVVLERSHSDLMPPVMDLSSLARSRDASRLFIFNKRENEFLARLFDGYLVREYPGRVAVMSELQPRTVRSVSVKLSLSARGTQLFDEPRICDEAGHCSPMRLQTVTGGEVSPNGARFSLTPVVPRQDLVFELNGPIELDGSHSLMVSISGESEGPQGVSIGPDGEFDNLERLHLPSSGHLHVPLFQFGDAPWLVNLRRPDDLLKIPPSPGRRLLFVTSPSIYDRYTKLDRSRFKGEDQVNVSSRQEFYRAMVLQGVLVTRISSGSGPIMEVYDVTSLGKRGSSVPENSPHGVQLIWFEPAALSECVEAATVMVYWDASSASGVDRVEVKTVRPNGEEGAFASAGPVGSKRTGPWMAAGRQLILRNGDDGSILARAEMGSLQCSAAYRQGTSE